MSSRSHPPGQTAPEFLQSVKLVRGLDPDQLREVFRYLRPFELATGEVLFRQDAREERMYFLEHGEVEAVRRVPGIGEERIATIGPGETFGELALLGRDTRTVTIRALEPATGYFFSSHAFAMLRADLSPISFWIMRRLFELVLERLKRRLIQIATDLGPEPGLAGSAPEVVPPVLRPRLEPMPGEREYLPRLPMFCRFERDELDELLDGLRRLELPRESDLVRPGTIAPALYVVLYGAIENTIERYPRKERTRLVGPGHGCAYVGQIDPTPSPIRCSARERTIVLEIPRRRLLERIWGEDIVSRKFFEALLEDVVLALREAERPKLELVMAGATLSLPPRSEVAT